MTPLIGGVRFSMKPFSVPASTPDWSGRVGVRTKSEETVETENGSGNHETRLPVLRLYPSGLVLSVSSPLRGYGRRETTGEKDLPWPEARLCGVNTRPNRCRSTHMCFREKKRSRPKE